MTLDKECCRHQQVTHDWTSENKELAFRRLIQQQVNQQSQNQNMATIRGMRALQAIGPVGTSVTTIPLFLLKQSGLGFFGTWFQRTD